MKYISRDEVDLLASGNGGLAELRSTIEQRVQGTEGADDDDDKDGPLYGFIKYRRRNVVLKYLSEDASRLIQGTTSSTCTYLTDPAHTPVPLLQPA